jgi:small-conductance mechanosensitive channel
MIHGYLNGVLLSEYSSDVFIDFLIAPSKVLLSENGEELTSLVEAQSLLAQLWDGFLFRLPGIAIGIAIMIAFIILASPLSRALVKPLTRTSTSPLLRSVFQRSISVLFVVFGIYIFLFLAGLTGFAIAVVSGTGVVGLILGFAFRDIAENFISSLLLTVQRPFSIGDIVQINEFTGIIQKVTARATTLVDFDGNHIQIPNATIYKGVIKNLTANPLMRGSFVIGVGYDASVKHAQQLAQSVIAQQTYVLTDPEPLILIDNLGPSTYNIKVYFWVNVEETSVIKMSSLLMREIVCAFDNAGISMPDDARERIFPQGLTLERENISRSPSQQNGVKTTEPVNTSSGNTIDDVATEAHDIREQARRSRDPEEGQNIL